MRNSITHISQFLPQTPDGSWVFLDIDDTLLREEKGSGTVQSISHNLIHIIEGLRARSCKVIYFTARNPKRHWHTKEQLAALELLVETPFKRVGKIEGVELGDAEHYLFEDGVLYAKKNSGQDYVKGAVLEAFIQYLKRHNHIESIPSDIVMVDDHIEQLESINSRQLFTTEGVAFHGFLMQPAKQAHCLVKGFPKHTSTFPDHLSELSYDGTHMDGGGGGVYLLRDRHDKRYVLKIGNQADQMKEEILADAISRALNVKVPNFAIYTHLPLPLAKQLGLKRSVDWPVRLSEWVSRDDKEEKGAEQSITKYFAIIAFLSNWDIVKEDNRIGDWLIDNGAGFRYRACGGLKEKNKVVSELSTLRDPRFNKLNPKIFASLSDQEILAQIENLLSQANTIFTTFFDMHKLLNFSRPEDLHDVIAARLNSLAEFPVLKLTDEVGQKATKGKSASILTYTYKDGKAFVLLGQRIRHQWWGNLGGKCDSGDTFLYRTACREVLEESNNLLQHDEQTVQYAPFVKLKSTSHTMYVDYHRFVSTDKFVAALEKAEGHHKEYTDFDWVPVESLLEAVEQPETKESEGQSCLLVNYKNSNGNAKSIILHPPLREILQQGGAISILNKVKKRKRIRRFESIAQQREALSQAVVYQADTINALKRKFASVDSREIKALELKEENTANSKISLSEIHLRTILKIPADKECSVEDIVTEFLNSNLNIAGKVSDHVKQQYINAIKEERRLQGEKVILYHAAPAEVAFLYDVYTEIGRLLHGQAQDGYSSFRLLEVVAKRFNNLKEFISYHTDGGRKSIDNYAQQFPEIGLSMNLFLFGNHNTATSSSYYMFSKNSASRSLYNQFIGDTLKEILMAMDTPIKLMDAIIQRFVDIYKNFYKGRGGSLSLVSIDKSIVDSICYPSKSIGVQAKKITDTQNSHDELSSVVAAIRNDDITDDGYIKKLQVRLILLAEQMRLFNSINVKTYRSVNSTKWTHPQVAAQQLRGLINSVVLPRVVARASGLFKYTPNLVDKYRRVARRLFLYSDYRDVPIDKFFKKLKVEGVIFLWEDINKFSPDFYRRVYQRMLRGDLTFVKKLNEFIAETVSDDKDGLIDKLVFEIFVELSEVGGDKGYAHVFNIFSPIIVNRNNYGFYYLIHDYTSCRVKPLVKFLEACFKNDAFSSLVLAAIGRAINIGVCKIDLLFSHSLLFSNIKLDNDGLTALHYSAMFGRDEVFNLLLQQGVDPLLATNDGRTIFSFFGRIVKNKLIKLFFRERSMILNALKIVKNRKLGLQKADFFSLLTVALFNSSKKIIDDAIEACGDSASAFLNSDEFTAYVSDNFIVYNDLSPDLFFYLIDQGMKITRGAIVEMLAITTYRDLGVREKFVVFALRKVHEYDISVEVVLGVLEDAIKYNITFILKEFFILFPGLLNAMQPKDGMTPLQLAVKYHNKVLTQNLLQSGADFIVQRQNGKTLIQLVCELVLEGRSRFAYRDVLVSILRYFRQENINGDDNDFFLLLDCATLFEGVSLVEEVVQTFSTSSRQLLAHLSDDVIVSKFEKCQVDVLQYLYQQGMQLSKLVVDRVLVSLGEGVHCSSQVAGKLSFVLKHIDTRSVDIKLVKKILAGAIINNHNDLVKDILQKFPGLLNEGLTADGETAFYLAVYHFQDDIASFLVDQGADIFKKSKQGLLPLVAFYKKYGENASSSLAYNFIKSLYKDKISLLHHAAQHGAFGFFSELIYQEDDVNKKDKQGSTALDYVLIHILRDKRPAQNFLSMLLLFARCAEKLDDTGVTKLAHYCDHLYDREAIFLLFKQLARVTDDQACDALIKHAVTFCSRNSIEKLKKGWADKGKDKLVNRIFACQSKFHLEKNICSIISVFFDLSSRAAVTDAYKRLKSYFQGVDPNKLRRANEAKGRAPDSTRLSLATLSLHNQHHYQCTIDKLMSCSHNERSELWYYAKLRGEHHLAKKIVDYCAKHELPIKWDEAMKLAIESQNLTICQTLVSEGMLPADGFYDNRYLGTVSANLDADLDSFIMLVKKQVQYDVNDIKALYFGFGYLELVVKYAYNNESVALVDNTDAPLVKVGI